MRARGNQHHPSTPTHKSAERKRKERIQEENEKWGKGMQTQTLTGDLQQRNVPAMPVLQSLRGREVIGTHLTQDRALSHYSEGQLDVMRFNGCLCTTTNRLSDIWHHNVTMGTCGPLPTRPWCVEVSCNCGCGQDEKGKGHTHTLCDGTSNEQVFHGAACCHGTHKHTHTHTARQVAYHAHKFGKIHSFVYTSLSSVYTSLSSVYTSLSSVYTHLSSVYSSLSSVYSSLSCSLRGTRVS